MTFQKTSLALLLALPLAVTAADSPTSPEPAGFIPGIPVLQAAKEAYFAQAKAENPSPAPAAPSSAIEKMRKEDFPEIAPFDIPGQTKKPVVQNECSDFTPAKNALDAMAQLYQHMDYDCLQYASTNNLELLGVPVLTYKMVGGSNYGKIDELVDEYPGKFYITQYINGKDDILYNIRIKISKKFFDAGGNLFDARIFPLDFPPTEERHNIAYIIAEPPESKFNLLDFWGDYAANSLYRWRKKMLKLRLSVATPLVANVLHFFFYFNYTLRNYLWQIII